MEYYRTDELYHHGIKGQRWGVRRYQNPDGTLTSAGKKRKVLFGKENWSARKEIDAIRKQYIRENKKEKGIRSYVKASRAGERYGEKILSGKYGEEAIKNLRVENAVLGVLNIGLLGILISDALHS